MHLPTAAVALAASLSLVSAELDFWAKKAGLEYFGAATDSPGQRERAGLQAAYATYDSILRDPKMFGSTTPTNGMKFMFTEPERGVFNYTEGEIVASLAKDTGKILRCHALVWHSQLAPWVEKTNWTAAALKEAIVNHVTNVAGHWKGRCYAWDVVNEALDEDGSYRKSVFYNVLGEEYLKIAFEAAAKADPTAKLYYNDYGIERPNNKSVGARRIVKLLQDAKLKIDGVGLQAHLHALSHPTVTEHATVMKSFADMGVDVAVTELDVRITGALNETNLAGQSEGYQNIVKACVQVKRCVGITVWDFYDPFSWVPYSFPGQGYAALWFANFTVHPAYDGLVSALKTLAGSNARASAT